MTAIDRSNGGLWIQVEEDGMALEAATGNAITTAVQEAFAAQQQEAARQNQNIANVSGERVYTHKDLLSGGGLTFDGLLQRYRKETYWISGWAWENDQQRYRRVARIINKIFYSPNVAGGLTKAVAQNRLLDIVKTKILPALEDADLIRDMERLTRYSIYAQIKQILEDPASSPNRAFRELGTFEKIAWQDDQGPVHAGVQKDGYNRIFSLSYEKLKLVSDAISKIKENINGDVREIIILGKKERVKISDELNLLGFNQDELKRKIDIIEEQLEIREGQLKNLEKEIQKKMEQFYQKARRGEKPSDKEKETLLSDIKFLEGRAKFPKVTVQHATQVIEDLFTKGEFIGIEDINAIFNINHYKRKAFSVRNGLKGFAVGTALLFSLPTAMSLLPAAVLPAFNSVAMVGAITAVGMAARPVWNKMKDYIEL